MYYTLYINVHKRMHANALFFNKNVFQKCLCDCFEYEKYSSCSVLKSLQQLLFLHNLLNLSHTSYDDM